MSGELRELVRHALTIARDQRYSEVELTVGEAHFRATLEPTRASARPAGTGSEPVVPPAILVKSTHVGYVQFPDGVPEVGTAVKAGDRFAVIAVLGILNDVEYPSDGVISEVLVGPDDAVDHARVLARLEAA
ncbi:MAG: biotin/lipoyl-containing protein [Fimbriimonadaceae bacterium]|nr:biotin/lipoyl-containing protein [Fimbriimonadaceae bacterium]